MLVSGNIGATQADLRFGIHGVVMEIVAQPAVERFFTKKLVGFVVGRFLTGSFVFQSEFKRLSRGN